MSNISVSPARLLLAFVLLSALSNAARAEAFDPQTVVTDAALAATVAYSSVHFDNGAFIHNYGSNLIAGGAFQEAVGIIAVVQNTGINAVVQQAVTTQIGSISFDID